MTIYNMDCRDATRLMIASKIEIDCIVTSPPYYAVRDYGVVGQLGLEASVEEYIDTMAGVFDLAKDVLAPQGTLWLNVGDTYKDKQMLGVPWRLALELQKRGWYLRSDIIWGKPNPMPESVIDRPAKAHEYVFLLAKSERYYYDKDSIAEPRALGIDRRGVAFGHGTDAKERGRGRITADGNGKADKQRGHGRRHAGFNDRWDAMSKAEQCSGMRNARTVWNIATEPFGGGHFATFPRELAKRCVLAGCPPGGTVYDPFMGSGTVAMVAQSLGRNYIGAELSPAYMDIINNRLRAQIGLAL